MSFVMAEAGPVRPPEVAPESRRCVTPICAGTVSVETASIWQRRTRTLACLIPVEPGGNLSGDD